MKIIVRGRRSGKTMELIKESSSSGNYILVRNHHEAQKLVQLAQEMKLSIPFPVTTSEIALGRIQGTSIKRDGILVDDAGLVLQQLIGTEINTLTISTTEEDDK